MSEEGIAGSSWRGRDTLLPSDTTVHAGSWLVLPTQMEQGEDGLDLSLE